MEPVKFIILGAMKAGSTSLASYIASHPDICFCKIKEPQFFSRNEKYEKGIGWYESLFDPGPNQISGEASTCYTRWPFYKDVPKRLYEYNPDLKFIYIIRDPAKRAYSHFRHQVLKEETEYSVFRDAIENDPEIISTSKYMEQINQYLKYFGKDQFLFLTFENIAHPTKEKFDEIFRFLEVSEFDVLSHTGKLLSNKAGSQYIHRHIKNSIIENRVINFLNKSLKKIFSAKLRYRILDFTVSLLSLSPAALKRREKVLRNIPGPLPEDNEYVMTRCLQDLEEFEKFSGLDLSGWKKL